MLRLNYDISQMRQLPVEIIGRGNNNYVRVRLPSHDNVECELGLKKSTQRGTHGAWGVCTIKNEYGNLWFKLEEKHYPNAKTSKWTLKKMQEAHLDLMNLLVKEEQCWTLCLTRLATCRSSAHKKGNQFTASAVRLIAPVPRNLYTCASTISLPRLHKPLI